MSSLPQGWHGIPGPSRNSISGATLAVTSAPTTIRKKWNSPLSSEVPKSKLPSFKSSNLRTQNLSNASSTRLSSKSSGPSPQSNLPTAPSKSSPSKEYQNEITKLKKELSTMKAENSILKAKVRRVDDENVQKSRQIEKMRSELKILQKKESENRGKNKESELLLLRQKCLRLEGALKEKDLALKKLTNDMLLKMEGRKDWNTKITNGKFHNEARESFSSKQKKSSESKAVDGGSSKSAQTSLSRANQSLKMEVVKLRDMIHKLEKENQELQQQVKENGLEVRRLKIQLRSKDRTLPHQNRAPKQNSGENIKTSKLMSAINVPNIARKSYTKQSTVTPQPLQKPLRNIETPLNCTSSSVQTSKTIPRASKSFMISPQSHESGAKSVKGRKSLHASGKVFTPSKQCSETTSKLPATLDETFVVAKSFDHSSFTNKSQAASPLKEVELEDKIQELRENLAAKKIQRSWRDHKKQCTSKAELPNENKAMTFIISSIKHHKLRKDKLNLLVKRRNFSPKLKEESENAIVEAIQAATRKIWGQEFIAN